MKKLFTSALLTVAAVPFLMAAPAVAKKAQNTSTPAASTKKPAKKHTKKASKTAASQTASSAKK